MYKNRNCSVLLITIVILIGSCLPRHYEKNNELISGQKNPTTLPDNVKSADNSYCYVCHFNYQEEKLTLNHQRSGIGCMDCHGQSNEHSADEDGITPPDMMYPKPKINAACMSCHTKNKIIIKPQHDKIFASAPVQTNSLCTDCHGNHRLIVRTRRWDKETGKLIADDGVRMMSKPTEQK